MREEYRVVVGLEVHAQLDTESKMFSREGAGYGEEPNTRISPLTLGHPGTLPSVNGRGVEMAIKMGLATECSIAEWSHFARKNYFYPDLPKGYQISQDDTPICFGGKLNIRLKDGTLKTIGITRIHIEEDAGKSIHDQDPFYTLVDFNRCGVGLIEIVSEPDITSAEEAAAYLTEIRKLVRYLQVCDGNMEEGSLRCDANVSVMKKDATKFGTRVEVKNMNSISNVARAISFEVERQIELIESGGKVHQQTRGWDASTGKTILLREKEAAKDYRYFPEPDLLPITVTEERRERLRAELPELPEARYKKYTETFGLPDFDATMLTEQREFAEYYEAFIKINANYKTVSNWLNGPVKMYLNEMALDITRFPLAPEKLNGLLKLVEAEKVSLSAARETLFRKLIEAPESEPAEIAERLGVLLEDNSAEIAEAVDKILAENADKVTQYLGGKNGLSGFFVGQVSRAFHGKADPKKINEVVTQKLEALRKE